MSEHGRLVAVEAAQLFRTYTTAEAMRHIFRTFSRRAYGVNVQQYDAQRQFAKAVNGYAFVLFHMIKDNTFVPTAPCFLLLNDEKFVEMLQYVKRVGKDEPSVNGPKEDAFIVEWEPYLTKSLTSFASVPEAYRHLMHLP